MQAVQEAEAVTTDGSTPELLSRSEVTARYKRCAFEIDTPYVVQIARF